ncbi:hypothetical protein CI109_100743 [Kwoniella shandongensis]|uniref:Uncharacterized protein n=1 Tax=Kwoniella shandongensis TaxID=1734106 RepID=A0A5M6BN06_9TREE|nr:uncharacterized protein CI109_007423 [Kwoniella shandongensis]KAA5524246.1 hypothetical protein CI109_007423 [Kwoniella shandongensis]
MTIGTTSSNKHLILLGTHGNYIHSAIFDSDNHTLTKGKTTATNPHPSWLTRNPKHQDIIYANGHVEGKVFAYRLTDNEGGLELLAEASSGGGGPTHLGVLADGSELLMAHYNTGTVTLLPLDERGLFKLDSPTPERIYSPPYTPLSHPRQESPHVHQIVIYNDEIIAPDLGSNKVWRLKWDGKSMSLFGEVSGLEVGDGPRHVVIHPNGTHIYVLNEISSQLTVHTIPAEGGSSKLVKRFSMLPEYDQGAYRPTGGAEIVLLPPTRPDGPHLLILSNRDSPVRETDTLALFSVSSTDGGEVERTKEGWYEGIGRHLRGVSGDPSGKYVAVLARNQGGLKVFERVGEDGLQLKEVATMEDVELGVVPLWIS